MAMRLAPPYILVKEGKMWIYGGANRIAICLLLDNGNMTNVNWPSAAPTQIRAQSVSSRAGSTIVAVTQGDKDLATFTIPTALRESQNLLNALEDEYVNVQLHTGSAGQPTDYSGANFGLGWVLCLRQPGTTAEVGRADNAGEGIQVPIEFPFAAVLGPIPIDWSARLERNTLITETETMTDVFTLPTLKDQDHGARVLPGQVGMLVADSAVGPALAGIYYFSDGLRTAPTACAADPFGAGVGCESVVGFGDKRNHRYIVAAELQAGVAPAGSYTDDDGTTWNAFNFGAVVGDTCTRLWIVHAGRIYGCGGQAGSSKLWYSTDQGASWTEVDPGLAQPLNDIQVMVDGIGYAVGDANVICKITNWDQVSTLTGPAGGAGDANLAVAIKVTTGELYVGNDAGELYHSDDEGATWNTVTANIQGITATQVDHIEFDMTGEYGFMVCTTAADVVTLRTTDRGASWREYDLGDGSSVANIAKHGLHVYGPNDCFVVGAASGGTAVVDEVTTDFDGKRQV